MRSRSEWRAATSIEVSTVRRAAPEGKWTTDSRLLRGRAEVKSDTRQDSTGLDLNQTKHSPRQKHRDLAEDQRELAEWLQSIIIRQSSLATQVEIEEQISVKRKQVPSQSARA